MGYGAPITDACLFVNMFIFVSTLTDFISRVTWHRFQLTNCYTNKLSSTNMARGVAGHHANVWTALWCNVRAFVANGFCEGSKR